MKYRDLTSLMFYVKLALLSLWRFQNTHGIHTAKVLFISTAFNANSYLRRLLPTSKFAERETTWPWLGVCLLLRHCTAHCIVACFSTLTRRLQGGDSWRAPSFLMHPVTYPSCRLHCSIKNAVRSLFPCCHGSISFSLNNLDNIGTGSLDKW